MQPQQGMLPDVLAPDLVAVFVGTSVSTTSAEGEARVRPPPANRFWELLDATGLPNRAGLCSSRDRELTDYGVALTDLVKARAASSDGLLESSDYDRSGCIASDRARARTDAIVRVARLRATKAIPELNLGVPA